MNLSKRGVVEYTSPQEPPGSTPPSPFLGHDSSLRVRVAQVLQFSPNPRMTASFFQFLNQMKMVFFVSTFLPHPQYWKL